MVPREVEHLCKSTRESRLCSEGRCRRDTQGAAPMWVATLLTRTSFCSITVIYGKVCSYQTPKPKAQTWGLRKRATFFLLSCQGFCLLSCFCLCRFSYSTIWGDLIFFKKTWILATPQKSIKNLNTSKCKPNQFFPNKSKSRGKQTATIHFSVTLQTLICGRRGTGRTK